MEKNNNPEQLTPEVVGEDVAAPTNTLGLVAGGLTPAAQLAIVVGHLRSVTRIKPPGAAATLVIFLWVHKIDQNTQEVKNERFLVRKIENRDDCWRSRKQTKAHERIKRNAFF